MFWDATNIVDLFLKHIHSDLPYCDKCSKSFIGTEYKLLMQSYSMLPRYGIEKLQIGEIEKNMFAVETVLSNK